MGKVTVTTASQNHSSSATHRTLQKSSTLARKYVKKPVAARKPAGVKHIQVASTVKKPVSAPKSAMRRSVATPKRVAIQQSATISRPVPAPAPKTVSVPRPVVSQKTVRARQLELQRLQAQKAPRQSRPTVATKEKAAKSALRSVAKMNEDAPQMKTKHKSHRILLATVCSLVTVIGIFFFVQTKMPDITVKVAALQTGIDAAYPSHIPRGYSLDTVTSEKDDSITMTFSNNEDDSFTLTEEKSSWDSTSLLNLFVKSNFSPKYTTLREQGITVYVDNGKAAWVNGGTLFKLTSKGRSLSKEQILNLVASI